MRTLGYFAGYLAVCCLAVVALAMPVHAIERAASLPYVYEVTKEFKKCNWDGVNNFEVLTNTASNGMQCVTVPTTTNPITIPSCTLTEYLGVEGNGNFTCKKISAVCGAGEVLNKIDNDTFGCTVLSASAVTNAPKCGENQVLQGDNGTTFSCVNIGDLALPKCNSGEVLTNLGGAVQCVDTVKSHFPTDCRAGQALTVENGTFACTTFTSGAACTAGTMALLNRGITYCVATSCAADQYLTLINGKPKCVRNSFSQVPSGSSCGNAFFSGPVGNGSWKSFPCNGVNLVTSQTGGVDPDTHKNPLGYCSFGLPYQDWLYMAEGTFFMLTPNSIWGKCPILSCPVGYSPTVIGTNAHSNVFVPQFTCRKN